jgi:hypothetical protein
MRPLRNILRNLIANGDLAPLPFYWSSYVLFLFAMSRHPFGQHSVPAAGQIGVRVRPVARAACAAFESLLSRHPGDDFFFRSVSRPSEKHFPTRIQQPGADSLRDQFRSAGLDQPLARSRALFKLEVSRSSSGLIKCDFQL